MIVTPSAFPPRVPIEISQFSLNYSNDSNVPKESLMTQRPYRI
jgi:hypothetical protein